MLKRKREYLFQARGTYQGKENSVGNIYKQCIHS